MNLINKNRQTSINVMFTSLSPACPVTVKECTTYHSMLGEKGEAHQPITSMETESHCIYQHTTLD